MWVSDQTVILLGSKSRKRYSIELYYDHLKVHSREPASSSAMAPASYTVATLEGVWFALSGCLCARFDALFSVWNFLVAFFANCHPTLQCSGLKFS